MNHDHLTRQQIDYLRAEIDARVRATLGRGAPACRGCDGPLDTYTLGCDTCQSRKDARRRREDPVRLERIRAQWREKRRRQRARARQEAA